MPTNNNVFDAGLVTSTLAQVGIITLGKALAPLKAFTADFSDQVMAPKSVVNVPLIYSAGSVLTNATDFEQSALSANKVAVTLNLYSRPWTVDFASLNSGLKLENAGQKAMQALGEKILLDTLSVATSANFTGASVVASSAATDFDAADLKAVWGSIGGTNKNIILEDSYYANFLTNDMQIMDPEKGMAPYGFKTFNHVPSSLLPSGTYSTKAFATNGNGIAIASAIPQIHPAVEASLYGMEVTEVPGLGLSILTTVWGSAATRSVWASYDVLYGYAVGDSTDGKLVYG